MCKKTQPLNSLIHNHIKSHVCPPKHNIKKLVLVQKLTACAHSKNFTLNIFLININNCFNFDHYCLDHHCWDHYQLVSLQIKCAGLQPDLCPLKQKEYCAQLMIWKIVKLVSATLFVHTHSEFQFGFALVLNAQRTFVIQYYQCMQVKEFSLPTYTNLQDKNASHNNSRSVHM